MTKQGTKAVALTAAALALLAGCGEPTVTPMDDEFAGNSGETQQSQEEATQNDSSGEDDESLSTGDNGDKKNTADTTSDKQDTGVYADGTYAVNGQYGPVGEDTIDVYVTVENQNVTNVKIEGHPFTSISKRHQTEFADAINGVVDGKPLKDLKVDKVAGASWTSEAFNEALNVARQLASVEE